MKYGTLYGKNIEEMEKEELINHFLNLYKQNQELGKEIERLKSENFRLKYTPKNFLQSILRFKTN